MNNKLFGTLTLSLLSYAVYAQDLDIDISSDGISIDSEQWYENPFFWAGVVALIVILFIVTRRGAKS